MLITLVPVRVIGNVIVVIRGSAILVSITTIILTVVSANTSQGILVILAQTHHGMDITQQRIRVIGVV
jgi:hypothetical protein